MSWAGGMKPTYNTTLDEKKKKKARCDLVFSVTSNM